MKQTIKIVTILMVAIMIVMAASPVFADDALTPDDVKPSYNATATGKLTTVAGKVMGVIRNVAVIASVIILMVVGVKFMLGSTEEKAEYKKSLMPLIIGIVIVVGATSIASFLFGMFA